MRQPQGAIQYIAALVVLGVFSVIWLFTPLQGFGPAEAVGLPVQGTSDSILLERALQRYAVLARNMTARIATAEQAIRLLQQRQGAAVAAPASPARPPQHQGSPGRPAARPAAAEGGGGGGGGEGAAAGGGFAAGASDAGGDGGGEGGEQEASEEVETDEEREKRQQAEEKEQRELIGYDEATRKFKRRWRPDFKCGDRVPALPDNEVVECDPASETPCCSSLGWCGKSALHCTCETCQDYQSQVKIQLTGIRVAAAERECSEISYSFGPQDSPRVCADLVLQQVECGRTFMFAHNYPSWGCRCCAAGTAPSQEAKPEWTVYALQIVVQPAAPAAE